MAFGVGFDPNGSFNLGNDITLQFVINGQTFSFPGIATEVGRKTITTEHEIVPLTTGQPLRRVIPMGFERNITMSRQDATFDFLVDALFQAYYQRSNPPVFTMTETIRSPQGFDQWQYVQGVLVPESEGTFSSNNPVHDVTFRVKFSQRICISGGATALTNLLKATSNL